MEMIFKIQRAVLWAALGTLLAGVCFGQATRIVSATVVDPSLNAQMKVLEMAAFA